MIVTPDFLDHWKTKALIELSKRPESPLWVLRLWAHCQTRKLWTFDLPPIALKSICSVASEISAEDWYKWLVECRFIDDSGSGKWTVHDWREHNATLVANWKNGRKPKRKRSAIQPEAMASPPQGHSENGSTDRLDKIREDRLDRGEEKRENTTPPRTDRPRKQGSVLPSEQSEPVCSRMLELGELFHRRPGTVWTDKEFAAFKTARLDQQPEPDYRGDFEFVKYFYEAPLPAGAGSDDARRFRRRELVTLLNNWPGELDRARAWCEVERERLRKLDEGRIGA